MTIDSIRKHSDSFTDETLTVDNCVRFVNSAIAEINKECDLLLDLVPEFNQEYNYEIIPDTWQIALFVMYVNYAVKMNDGSLNEAEEYKINFYDNLNKFKDVVQNDNADGTPFLDDKYKGPGFGGIIQIDTTEAIDNNWFGPNSIGRGGGY